MDQLVLFITQHWILSSLFIGLIVLWIAYEIKERMFAMPHVTPQQAVELMNHQSAVVIDVRNENAFLEGHISEAMCVPHAILTKRLPLLEKQSGKPIIIVCNMGQDLAPKVYTELKNKGFNQLFILKGGLQGWRMAGLPLVKK